MTPIQIANLGLGWLGVSPIASFDETSRPAELVNEQFEGLRDAVLEERDWSFAIGRLSLSLDPVQPQASSYSGRYVLPSSVIRVLRAWEGSSIGLRAISQDVAEESGLDWQIEAAPANEDGTGTVGRYIVAATTANPLEIKALLRTEDSGMWTPGFCQALAARIAADLCIPITQDKVLARDMWALYDKKLTDAAANDGRQGAPQKIRSNYLKNARG